MTHNTTNISKLLATSAFTVIAAFSAPVFVTADDGAFSVRTGPSSTFTEANMLDNVQVQMRNDSSDVNPYLNVVADNNAVIATRSEGISFYPFWNYGAFIERAEVRLIDANKSLRSDHVMVLPVQGGVATLPSNADLPEDVSYLLRVYDAEGNFDETAPKFLTMVDEKPHQDEEIIRSELEGFGIDRTARRNIKLRGNSVTVYGSNAPNGSTVSVMGQAVPIDNNGKFVREMILPYGDHQIGAEVNYGGKTLNVSQDLFLDNTDFFYVAIGDLTLGSNNSVGPADFLSQSDEDFDDVGVLGRGAFYATGKVKGDYRVTASVDTGEDRIQDLFNNLDEKDPRQLLRRLDGDRFYPVYGDDSQIREDAPTQGRFYVRVEKDDSHILWGNFTTQITGTEFAHLDRGLYGGILDYRSKGSNSSGDRNTHLTAFAADPGTIPAREEFRGTGGSLYFLQRQDLSIGSERLRVEIRDKISGLVIETRELRPQNDYDIDYIQGRVLLSQPLQSFVRDNEVVRTSSLSGNEAYLVARYEFTPTLSDVGGYTVGGRATQWIGDNLRVGATAQRETTDSADQNLFGADVVLRRSDSTYVKLEYAQTRGPGFGQSNSVDGGFNFDSVPTAGVQNVTANAYRVEGAVDLQDVTNTDGRLQAYYDRQESGFSGSGRLIEGDLERWGAALNTQVSDSTDVTIKYDEIDGSIAGSTRSIYGDVSQKIGDELSLSAGIRHDDRQLAAIGSLPAVNGSRTDASVQVDYDFSEHFNAYGFGQLTLDNDATRQSNDRYGIGADIRITERLSVAGEVSEGDLGFGAQAKATLQRADGSEVYLGYALSPDNRTTGLNTQMASHDGTFTAGGRKRFNDRLSVYGEERLGHGRYQRSLTHAYGLDFNPNEQWSFGVSAENGTVEERATGEEFERTAVALSAARRTASFRFATNLEARFEDSRGAAINRDRQTWLVRNTVAYDASKDVELLGRFNFAISESDEASFLDADFVEGVVGAAYRPVNNDRLNALVKYTYFEDLAPSEQVTAGGTINTARQKSQIFSVDAIYDLTEKLSVGGKYGFRSGEVAFDRTSDDFIKSDAQLGVVRLDYHVLSKWDLLAEGRILTSSLADNQRLGALAGVYRHLGENAKVGVGYNFANFSDDLTDFDDDSQGFFLNVLGKF